MGLGIPWSSTNRPYDVEIDLLDADGGPVTTVASLRRLEDGRPSGLRPGSPQRRYFAFPVDAEFPSVGRYVFTVAVDGEPGGATAIEVVQFADDSSPQG